MSVSNLDSGDHKLGNCLLSLSVPQSPCMSKVQITSRYWDTWSYVLNQMIKILFCHS